MKQRMQKCLAFVLAGGGARGAMQVGAMRSLLEAGLKPNLLVGTSIGAVNATGLALWGMDRHGIEALEQAYQKVADSRIMDPRLIRAALGALSRHPNRRASRRIEEFFISEGITPDLRFNQIADVRLGLVSADLASGAPVVYGTDAAQSVLQGLMASIALPPWFAPIEKDSHLIVDGGVLSNLPIEPALMMGATEIIALDLNDPSGLVGADSKMHGQYLERLIFAITERQICLEMDLASARNVPVHYVSLRSSPSIPIWDFRNHRELFKIGYEIMQQEILDWPQKDQAELALPYLVKQEQSSWT
jgi:NTE family protein